MKRLLYSIGIRKTLRMKARLLKIGSNILPFILLGGILYLIHNGWQDKIIYIDGHRYIEHPTIDGSDIEHSPSCWCNEK